MRKLVMLILLFCGGVLPLAAQDAAADAAYQKALRRIEAARTTNDFYLDLSDLGLTALPPEIGTLPNLRSLVLIDNQLTILPAEIGNLTGLVELYASHNQLTSLPPEIGQLKLRWLYLDDNQLTSLPPEIGNLKLYVLDLSHNPQLITLPPEMNQVTTLLLSNNAYTTLPAGLFDLTSLLYLDISQNQLTHLPAEIAQLSQLCGLNLSANQLRYLPTELTQITQLGMENCLPRIGVGDGGDWFWLGEDTLDVTDNPLVVPPTEILQQGTPAILAYLRDYEALMLRKTIAGIAAGCGGLVTFMLAFRWRQRRSGGKKKRV